MRKLRIAIQADDSDLMSGKRQSFSERWQELAAIAGHETVSVDAYSEDFFDSLSGCDGFMWYFPNAPFYSDLGKRLMLAIHQGMKLPTFPSWRTCWFFEDKHAQHYLLKSAGVPTPSAWVFWGRSDAEAFIKEATYPLVFKLSFGIASANVRLLNNRKEARYLIDRLFGDGMSILPMKSIRPLFPEVSDRLSNTARSLLGKRVKDHFADAPIQRGCALFQEFVPDNHFDVRVTIIGNRAFAFRRMNRPGDFRASGSGSIDWDPSRIDLEAVELGFDVARKVDSQVLTLDILKRQQRLVVVEISYYYEAWAVHRCPGHWRWVSSAGDIEWVDGEMRPDDAIFEDFLGLLAGDPCLVDSSELKA